MNKEEYKFDHFKDIDEVMHYFNYWYKEDDVFAIDRYLSLEDFNYISNKYQNLQQERDKYKSIVEELKEYIKIEKEKNLQLGTSTNDLEYRAHSLAMQIKLCEIEDKIKELEEGNSNE